MHVFTGVLYNSKQYHFKPILLYTDEHFYFLFFYLGKLLFLLYLSPLLLETFLHRICFPEVNNYSYKKGLLLHPNEPFKY